jgi:Tol biopolymer transport system component
MNGDLGVFDTVSGEPRILTNRSRYGGFAFESSVLSADGTRIAFAWEDVDGARELRVMSANGTDTQVVLARPYEITHPLGWSRDGAQILVRMARDDGPSSLALVALANGVVKRIVTVDASNAAAALSPDGRYVVFENNARHTAIHRDLFIAAVDGSAESRPLVASSADEHGPHWTADGRRVVFISDRTGAPGIWAVSVDAGVPSGEPVLLHADVGRASAHGLSIDGTLFYTTPAPDGRAAGQELWALDRLLKLHPE